MSSTVECPHCGHENDMSNADLSSNEFDWECDSCEREFEVQVEWGPSFSASEIGYEACQECGRETRDPQKRGMTFPFPKGDKTVLCYKCYCEYYGRELEQEAKA